MGQEEGDMSIRYKVIFEPSQYGGFAVHVPGLPGCHTRGDTLEGAIANARDAIQTYLLTVEELTRQAPQIVEVEMFCIVKEDVI